MTKDEALNHALQLVSNLRTHSWTVADTQFVITAIKEALAQPEQEPVAFVQGCNRGQWEIFPAKAYQIFENEQPLYTTPPQRTWVGLTNDELTDLFYNENLGQESAVSQAIALLKERNT